MQATLNNSFRLFCFNEIAEETASIFSGPKMKHRRAQGRLRIM
jgi:hypothetical protein